MKKKLDYRTKEIVNIYDEINLWSAPFGKLLLENIPMRRGMKVVDIGFGTGFPLIELSQRFGPECKIIGVDIWEEGINRTKEKIKTLEIENIEILTHSANKMKIANNEIDLVVSNLGVNNFSDKELVYQEVFRVLKKGGTFSITTNPVGTFKELFRLFKEIILEIGTKKELANLTNYIANRGEESNIIQEIENENFQFIKRDAAQTIMRFLSAEALLDHSLMRVGFRDGWENLISTEIQSNFFKKLSEKIEEEITRKGEFRISIPVLYLEFRK